MRTSLWFLLAIACGDPNPLGGQEGEPIVPAEPPPAAPDTDTDAGVACEISAHCMGDGWCVEYGAEAQPDLETECPDTWATGPCPSGSDIGSCALPDGDACSTIHVTDPDSVDLCE